MKLIFVLFFGTFARRPHVGVKFEPQFECKARCMSRIGTIFSHVLKNVNLDDIEGDGNNRNRRDAGAQSDQICIEDVKRINWKNFVESDLCEVVKQYLPQCRGRLDSCIKCYGNGTYGMHALVRSIPNQSNIFSALF